MPWSAIASIAGGLLGSSSASDAADAQAGATAASIAEQRRQYDLTRSDYAPYRQVGNNALQRLAALYGIGGGSSGTSGGMSEADIRQMLTPQYTTAATQGGYVDGPGPEGAQTYQPGTAGGVNQAGLDAAVQQRMAQQGGQVGGAPQTYNDGLDGPLQMDPGYQFGMDQGQQALDRKIAAAGGRVSGASLKAAQRYGVDYATTGYNSAYQRRSDRENRLAALAGIGQTSTAGSAQAGQASANNISSALQSQGNASGAASLAQGNIWGNALNQGAAAWQRNQQSPSAGNAGDMSFGGATQNWW